MTQSNLSSDDRLREQLRCLLQSIEASGRSVLPRVDEDLLQSIVEAAARIFGAAAASIALIDEAAQMLEFKVSYGAGNETVVGLRIPLNSGIAGYTIMTGQPIAVRNVQQDARFAQSFAQSTGYVPKSILAMPLFIGDEVIGVMEVLDKIDAPAFGMQDMELLGLFAKQAAIAIRQSQQVQHLNHALVDGLREIAQGPGTGLVQDALDQAQNASPQPALLEIADRLFTISQMGEAEQRACLDILKAFQAYSRSKTFSF